MAYIGIVWIVGRKENMVTMLFTSGSFLLVMSISQKGPWSLSEDSELKCFIYCDNSDPLDQGFYLVFNRISLGIYI